MEPENSIKVGDIIVAKGSTVERTVVQISEERGEACATRVDGKDIAFYKWVNLAKAVKVVRS